MIYRCWSEATGERTSGASSSDRVKVSSGWHFGSLVKTRGSRTIMPRGQSLG